MKATPYSYAYYNSVQCHPRPAGSLQLYASRYMYLQVYRWRIMHILTSTLDHWLHGHLPFVENILEFAGACTPK